MFLDYRARIALNVPEAKSVLMAWDITHWEGMTALRFIGEMGQTSDRTRLDTAIRGVKAKADLDIDPVSAEPLEPYINRFEQIVHLWIVDITLHDAQHTVEWSLGSSRRVLLRYDELRLPMHGVRHIHQKSRDIFLHHLHRNPHRLAA